MSDAKATMTDPSQASRESPRSHGWLWFFAGLFVLTVAGICLEIWFNEEQRLSHEQIARAQAIWEQNRPAEYEMSYSVQEREHEMHSYVVRVRKDGSFGVTFTDDKTMTETKLRAGEYPYVSMEDLFERMDEQLNEARQPGSPRVFATASFDRRDGHVMRYVRSIRATRQRLEVNVQYVRNLAD